MLRSFAAIGLIALASNASAVTVDLKPVGTPGNACDPQPQGCFGTVNYAYYIGTYEITNAQYVEFLNAKAASDPLGLYSTFMSSGYGGITRSGSSGSYTYGAIVGRANMPVNNVSVFSAMRFVNWIANGQGNGDTETGAYTLEGGGEIPTNQFTVKRNPGALVFLPTEDEWHKAAYYDPATGTYYDFPAKSDAQTTCSAPALTPNTANCGGVGDLTNVGSYPGSPSPFGTVDQGGNVWEWNETVTEQGGYRGMRGGAFVGGAAYLAASSRYVQIPNNHLDHLGFRIAAFPEPSTPAGLLSAIGMLVLLRRRRS